MDQDLLHAVVTIANAGFTAFRIAAHVPQLIAVVRDPGGARAISVASWVMFAMANASNAVYALVLAHDWLMFGINLTSAASCIAVASVALFKQRRAAARDHGARAPTGPVARPARPRPYRIEATVFD